ncbi:MAG: thioredoxin family protein [Thermosphaera sp.]
MKKIEVLGSGCPKCKQTARIMQMAVEELGIQATVEKVEDINEIINRGIVATPAVVIDGKVVFSGRIPTLDEAKEALKRE